MFSITRFVHEDNLNLECHIFGSRYHNNDIWASRNECTST